MGRSKLSGQAAAIFLMLFLLVPAIAFAQGSYDPFLIMNILLVFIGPILIGLVEYVTVRLLYGYNARAFIIVIGNYFSVFIGAVVASMITSRLGMNFSLAHSPHLFIYTINYFIYFYFISLIIEYIFYYLSISKFDRNYYMPLKFAVYANLVSFTIICCLYLLFEIYYVTPINLLR